MNGSARALDRNPRASRLPPDRTPDRIRAATETLLRGLDESEAVAAESSWTVGYLDVLLLLLTLFAVLLGVTYLQVGDGGGERRSVHLNAPLPIAVTPAELEPGVVLAAMQGMGTRAAPAPATVPAAPALHPKALRPMALKAVAGLSVRPDPVSSRAPALDPGFARIARLLADAPDDGLELLFDQRQIRLEVRDTVLFALGSATLGEAARPLLDRVAQGLLDSDLRVSVEGHTDDLPIATNRFPSNWELSAARAASVARYLVDLGLAESRLRVSGFADVRPRAPNDSPANRSRNRRVTIVLSLAEGQEREQPAPGLAKGRAL